MENMPEGFYTAKEVTLFDKENTLYVYPSGEESYGMCIETGEMSCFWDMTQFKYCDDQNKLKEKYHHILPGIN
jgi:hypothetical protein